MKPDQFSADMTLALERMIFKGVRDRSPFAASFYPSSASTFPREDIQPIRAYLPHDGESSQAIVALSIVAESLGMSEEQARNHILTLCHETLDDEHFPHGYLGENPESLRQELIESGYVCYLVGFEAGSVDQCAMFGEIVDSSVDKLATHSVFDNLNKIQKATNKLLAGTYFTQMMMVGAQSSEFHNS